MYAPKVIHSRTIRHQDLSSYHVEVLMTDILAEGLIRYTYLLTIRHRGIDEPIACVSSEPKVRRRWIPPRSKDSTGSHFLHNVMPPGHLNCGLSDD